VTANLRSNNSCGDRPQSCDFGQRKFVNLDLLEWVSCKRGETEVSEQPKYRILLSYPSNLATIPISLNSVPRAISRPDRG
jgi:hypothetical protein